MAYINLPGLGTSGNEDIEMISISMCMYVYGYIYIYRLYLYPFNSFKDQAV